MTLRTVEIVCVVLVVIGILLCAHWALNEHDSRIRAEAQVSLLQQHVSTTDASVKTQVATIQSHAKKIKTTAQAIIEIPKDSAMPLNPRPIQTAPQDVQVEALPLYNEIEQCNSYKVQLDGCLSDVKDLNAEVTIEKKKPSFWHRVKHDVIVFGVGAATVFVLIHK